MKHVFQCTGHALKIPDVVDSEGVYVIDREGKRYMDLEAGVWCMSLGHRNPRVNQALSRQMDAVVQAGFNYSSSVVDRAAAKVLEISGMTDGKCLFLCSGSEAIEVNRQMARHLVGSRPEPTLSMTLHDSYLGAYSSVADRSSGWYLFDWTPCAGCPDRESCRKDCALLEQIPGNISEFVFEPGSSSGFVRFPPVSMIRNLTERVRKKGGLLLVNEVTTGVGRTGAWFGYQHYGIEPDLIALGKGIGNGYPVSVAVIRGSLVPELEASRFHYSQSHQNDPLGAAVVREVIAVIEEEDLIDRARRLGDRFLEQLGALVDGTILTGLRGRGLMMALDVRDAATTEALHQALLERGFLTGNRGTSLRIDPPLTIAEEEFEAFVDELIRVVGEVSGGRPGN